PSSRGDPLPGTRTCPGQGHHQHQRPWRACRAYACECGVVTAPAVPVGPYAARLTIDYPERLDRVTTFVRLIWVIPIAIVLGAITGSGTHLMVTAAGEHIVRPGGGLLTGLASP